MTNNKEIQDIDCYNTSIKDIAGVKDATIFYQILGDLSDDCLEADICNYLLTDIRAERTRTKIAWACKKSLLQFLTEDHRVLIKSIFSHRISNDDLRFAFFWHFSLNNRLFREISTSVLAKVYYSGRVSISQDDIIPFIKEIKKENGSPLWAEETTYRLATKYLSLLTKLNFVSSGRIKSFQHIRPSSEAQVLFLYFAQLYSANNNILANDLLSISFISQEDLQERLKKLSLKGFFNMTFNGVALNIELTHSYKGICDALYN